MRQPRALSLLLSVIAASLFVATASDSKAGTFNKQRDHRQIPSWYFSLSGSVNFVEDSSLSEQGGPLPQSGTLEYDEGYGIAAAVGYRPRYTGSFLDHLRAEFEFGVADNDFDQFAITGVGVEVPAGDIQVVRAMGNAFIDMDLSPQWRPYLGGGLGAARVQLENEEDTVFAWQGMAGINYVPTRFPLAEIGVGYRYFNAGEAQFTTQGTGSQVEIDYEAHSLEAGVRLYF